MNILIAYYSWSGNTKKIAEQIQKETGGTLFEIRPKEPYSGNYNECLKQAKKDIKARYLPDVESLSEYPEFYDVVFIGTPNWWSSIAPPVAAFLAELSLFGKIIAPFCSHGGGGLGNCEKNISKLCPDADVKNAMPVYGSNIGQKALNQWLETIVPS